MDSVFINGHILTMDPNRSHAEAIAVEGGRITAIGYGEEVMSIEGSPARMRDLEVLFVIPGLIDSHMHLVGYGLALGSVSLREARSIEDIKNAVRERVGSTEPDGLIAGSGWDQEKLAERRFPNRRDLDEVAPLNPVVLSRVCGHMLCLNSVALRLVGVDSRTPDPPGGEIIREGESGDPNGLLKETAADLAWERLPQPSDEQRLSSAERACNELVKVGLTTVHFMSASWPEVKALIQLRREGRLPIRVRLYVHIEDLDKVKAELADDDFLMLCGVKVFMDGSLGARTALLSRPYSDDPSTTGISVIDDNEAREKFESVHHAGLQLAIHSIGDEATKKALDMIQLVLNDSPRSDHRHRIEHASVLNPHLMDRIKDLRMIASVQPHFVISDFWAVRRVGEDRAKGVYAFRSLRKRNIVTPAGSDCPVEPPDPFLGMRAAVTRGEREGIDLSEVTPKEKLSNQDVLAMYTTDGAFASREENVSGILKEGAFADFVVLSCNPLSCTPEELGKIEVRMTVVGGKVVYESERR